MIVLIHEGLIPNRWASSPCAIQGSAMSMSIIASWEYLSFWIAGGGRGARGEGPGKDCPGDPSTNALSRGFIPARPPSPLRPAGEVCLPVPPNNARKTPEMQVSIRGTAHMLPECMILIFRNIRSIESTGASSRESIGRARVRSRIFPPPLSAAANRPAGGGKSSAAGCASKVGNASIVGRRANG